MRFQTILSSAVFILSSACAGEAAARVPVAEIFRARQGVWYLGKARSRPDFSRLKQAEGARLKRDMEKQFSLPFRVHTTRYFNIAWRCPREELRFLSRYLVTFFREIYPRYFRYEPISPFRVVYFRSQREFHEKTGSGAYGFYRPTERTLYTWSRSGHGTLWHEMIHAFVHDNTEFDPQQWFNEGFASFYEMAFLKGGRVDEGYSNWRMPSLRAARRRGKVPHLDRFLRERWMGISFGYAHARFFFCYLWKKRKMVPFVRAYLYQLLPKYSGEALGREAVKLAERLLGKPIAGIHREYLALVGRTPADRKLYR